MKKSQIHHIILTIIIFNIISSFSVSAQDSAYHSAANLYKTANYTAAARQFKKIRDFSENTAELREKAAFFYALSNQAMNKLNTTQKAYIYILDNFPKAIFISSAIKQLISIFITNTEYPKALNLLYKLEKIQGLTVKEKQHILILKIICFTHLKQYKNASESITIFINNFPASTLIPQLQLWQAWYNITLNNFPKAETLYNTLLNNHPTRNIRVKAERNLAIIYLKTERITEATQIMLALFKNNYNYPHPTLLWLAKYFSEIRELNTARNILEHIIKNSEKAMIKAIARKDLAENLTANRDFHDALSNYPLIKKELIEAENSIAQIDYLNKLADYANARTLRKLGNNWSSLTILNQLQTSNSNLLYYNIMYEQGLIALELNNEKEAAKKLMQVGILSTNPDLAGKSLLECYEACKKLHNIQLIKLCLEELAGKNKGSYGQIHPNSPYTAQAQELLKEISK